jgi:hypothetical protein
MITPWGIIISFSVLITILTIIAAGIPAQITASKQTGNILRED